MLQVALTPSKACPTCKQQFGSGEIFCPVDGTRLANRSQMDGPAAPIDPKDPLIGVTLAGRYRVTRRIGEGGMGIVYEARHIIIEKKLALKVLRDDCSNRPDVVERFRQEARSASLIGHEHIVDISDFGETPTGQSYFVMEMLEGEDLANQLAKQGTIQLSRALSIALQCAKALGAAHAKGIVHRDMKPENIFLTQREGNPDFVKIVDFGIAKMSDIETAGDPSRKLTKTGMIFGTPEYMSPEQAAGKPLDHRVDVYALGVILYEVLTGRVPFVGDTFMGILTQHLFEPPPPMQQLNPQCEATRGVEAIIKKALQKEAKNRFQSMEEMAEDLARERESLEEVTAVGLRGPVRSFAKRITGGHTTRATLLSVERPAWLRPAAGRRWLVWGAGGLALLLVAGLAAWRWLPRSQPPVVRVIKSKAPVAAAPRAATLPAAAPRAAPAPTPPAATSPVVVRVRVTSHPAGAAVSIAGRGEVCSGDPCVVTATPGEALKLRASLGRAVATQTFVPSQAAEQTLDLQLREPKPSKKSAAPAVSAPPPAAPAEPAARGKRSMGDLKVPDIFR